MMSAIVMASVLAMSHQATGAATGQDGAQQPTPGQLISKMFAKYNAAKSLTAEISYTIQVAGQTATVNTTLQYQRPGLLYIRQGKSGVNQTAMAVCDGTHIAYTRPFDDTLKGEGNRTFGELALNPDLSKMTVGDAYTAMSMSLYDRSTATDILIGNPTDLEFVMNQWASLKDDGAIDFNGVKARQISGEWRPYKVSPSGQPARIEGKYDMTISEEGDLLQFRLLDIGYTEAGQPVPGAMNTWVVKAKVDAPADAKLFDTKLVKG